MRLCEFLVSFGRPQCGMQPGETARESWRLPHTVCCDTINPQGKQGLTDGMHEVTRASGALPLDEIYIQRIKQNEKEHLETGLSGYAPVYDPRADAGPFRAR